MPEQSDKAKRGTTSNETLYLCNFRVSVDGDWLCLKELQDQANPAFPTTPEFDHILNYYPDYPLQGKRDAASATRAIDLKHKSLQNQTFLFPGRDPALVERSNLVSILRLVIKEVIDSSLRFGRQLDSDHIPLQHFFIVLEHVLRHGLKPKKVLG